MISFFEGCGIFAFDSLRRFMARVLIIYGTTGGNTELTVEEVVDLLKEKKIDAKMMKVEKFAFDSLWEEMGVAGVVILASPTYGHGQLQEHMIPFFLKLSEMKLEGKPYAVIGLGEPKYDSHYHIESSTILEKAMNACKAKKIHYALKISRSPVLQMENLIPKWTEKLAEAIKQLA